MRSGLRPVHTIRDCFASIAKGQSAGEPDAASNHLHSVDERR